MTPEAKLLELIKKATPGRKNREPVFFRARFWRPLVLQLNTAYEQWAQGLSHLTLLQKVNRMLLLGSLVGLAYIFLSMLWPSRPWDGPSIPSGATNGGKISKATHRFVVSDLTRRNLFTPLIASAPQPTHIAAAPEPPPPPKIPLSQRMSHLRLVGIMNTEPAQAIIEDQNNQRTLYVSVGQSIQDATVDKISSDRVTLVSGDDRYDLTM